MGPVEKDGVGYPANYAGAMLCFESMPESNGAGHDISQRQNHTSRSLLQTLLQIRLQSGTLQARATTQPSSPNIDTFVGWITEQPYLVIIVVLLLVILALAARGRRQKTPS